MSGSAHPPDANAAFDDGKVEPYDVGPPGVVKVPAPPQIWVTTAPPVSINLPLTLKVKDRGRGPLCALLSGIGYAVFVFGMMVLLYTVLFGARVTVSDRMFHVRAVIILFSCAISFPSITVVIYFTVIRNLLGDLVIGTGGFIDARSLAEPIMWQDVKKIEEVCNMRTIVGLRLTLRTPCFFHDRYLSSLEPSWLFARYKTPDRLYIDLYSMDCDGFQVAEIFKAKATSAVPLFAAD